MKKNSSKGKRNLFFLVFDLGTSNLKIGIFKNNQLLTAKKIDVTSLVSGPEINIPPLQELFFKETKKLWKAAGEPKIEAIGGVGIMHGLVLFNRSKKQFEQAFTYSNLEAEKEASRLRKISKEVYLARGSPPFSSYAPEQVALRNKKKKLKNYLFYPSTSILLGPISKTPLKITKVALSHLGFLNLKTLRLDPLMLKFSGASPSNFSIISDDFNVGKASREWCLNWGFPLSWANKVALMDLGGDGLIIHELINDPSVGSFKIESTTVIRTETRKPVLEDVQEGQIPVSWSYLHDRGRFIWGAALSAGALTIHDYLSPKLNYKQLDSLLEKKIQHQGIPPLSKVGIGLPFSRGERAPGWKGKRPHGIRGKKPRELIWQYYLWKEAVAFNMAQVVAHIKKTSQQQKVFLPQEFIMTGVANHSKIWAKLVSLVCNLKLVKVKTKNLNLKAAANRVLKTFCRRLILLEREKVYNPEAVLFPNSENLKRRYKFYLEQYQQS